MRPPPDGPGITRESVIVLMIALGVLSVFSGLFVVADHLGRLGATKLVLRQAVDVQHRSRWIDGRYLTDNATLRLKLWMKYGDRTDITLNLLPADGDTYCLSGRSDGTSRVFYATPAGVQDNPCAP